MKVIVVKLFFIWIVILHSVWSKPGTVNKVNPEEEIYTKILIDSGYNAEIKPTGKAGKVTVLYDLTIQSIQSLDVKTQVLTVSSFIFLRWHDRRLEWNKTEYNDVETIQVGNTLPWTPDIMLYNDAREEQKTHLEMYKTKVIINSDGIVLWRAPAMLKVICAVDITWFPIDLQICNLTFGSWSYNANLLNIKLSRQRTADEIRTEYFVPSGEWFLDKVNSVTETTKFECCLNPFSTVTLTLNLLRYPKFYYIYVFFPFLSQVMLFLLIFHLQPEHGDRLGYGVALLLNMTMYMIFLSDKLPEKSDNQPFVGTLFVTLFFMLSIGLGLSAVTMMLSRRETPVPKAANKLKRFLYEILLKILKWCGCCCRRKKGHSDGAVWYGSFKKTTKKSDATHDDSDEHPSGGEQVAVISPSQQQQDEGEDGYQDFEGWNDFTRFLDKGLFYFFLFLLFFVPIIIGVSLDPSRKGRGIIFE